MTTPKEALEQIAARSIAKDDDDEKELRRQLYHIESLAKSALASLEGDAVERVARIMVRSDPNYCTYHMPGDTPRDWKATSGYRGKTSELSESAAESVRVRARAILAAGLVPDESAIRADEREKCAKVCDQIRNNAERRAAQHENGEARNSALDKMEGAIQCAAAIRSGGAQ